MKVVLLWTDSHLIRCDRARGSGGAFVNSRLRFVGRDEEDVAANKFVQDRSLPFRKPFLTHLDPIHGPRARQAGKSPLTMHVKRSFEWQRGGKCWRKRL